MSKACWMVRSGRKAQYLDDFREKSVVAIGWEKAGDLSGFKDQLAVLHHVEGLWPDWHVGKQRMSASQIWRFAHEIDVGDRVLTYDPQARTYLVGEVTGHYEFGPGLIEENPHVRKVAWSASVPRDSLSTASKNSLGAISTLFRVPPEVNDEISAVLSGEVLAERHAEEAADDEALVEDIESKALEFIKDRLSKLDWDEMQELVAGILRAMGYKTRVSPAGPDRGKDIVASPDGFGFESPRIIVEVKHRKESMGSTAIRSFLGGRHADDKGLYVSTGGFSKDAFYEAERANIPLTLMNLDGLVETLIEHYENMDPAVQRLVPLKRVYWPV